MKPIHAAALLLSVVILHHESLLSQDAGTTQQSIGEYLDSTGRLTLPSSFFGNLDPSGYSMRVDADGTPRFISSNAAAPGDEFWDGRFGYPGTQQGAYVSSIGVTGSGAVYLGGNFTLVIGGADSSNRIARYDPATRRWSTLGTGLDNVVYAVAVDGEDVYAAGLFQHAGGVGASRIARWDNAQGQWSALGSGLSGGTGGTIVSCCTVSGGYVYVGGLFTNAGGVPVHNIARCQLGDTLWSDVGGGITGINAQVYALASDSEGVIAGGSFTSAGGKSAGSIARWTGSGWEALGKGVNGTVSAVAPGTPGTVYAGGNFTTATDSDGTVVPANALASFSSSNRRWSAVGGGVTYSGDYGVGALRYSNGTLFVGGVSAVGATHLPVNNVARYDGTWRGLDSGVVSTGAGVMAFGVAGPRIFTGGEFAVVSNLVSRGICAWNDSSSQWEPLGWGIEDLRTGYPQVNAILVDPHNPNNIFIAGQFDHVGGLTGAFNVARFNLDRQTWIPMGRGTHAALGRGTVYALGWYEGDVYVGGVFDTAGTLPVKNLARWNTVLGVWEDPGANPDGPVYALQQYNVEIYAGGNFTSIGGIASPGIGRSDGTTWSALGGGVNGPVYALATDKSALPPRLYVGGSFTSVSQADTLVYAGSVARWDGAAWSSLGGGISSPGPAGSVRALMNRGKAVYAGGDFMQVRLPGNGIFFAPARRAAKFDGTTWSEFAGGVDTAVPSGSIVNSIARLPGGKIILAGKFSAVGDTAANNIAASYDYHSYPMGSGTEVRFLEQPTINALAPAVNDLYVGGYFARAGGKPALGLTRWNKSLPANAWTEQPFDSTIRVRCATVNDAGTAYLGCADGRILFSTDGGQTWQDLNTGTTADINDIYSAGASTLMAGTQAGEVLCSSDGGSSFSTSTPGGGIPVTSSGMSRDLLHGVVTKDSSGRPELFLTSNGGNTWARAVDPGHIIYDGTYTEGNVLIVVGQGGIIYRTTDFGVTWSSITSGTSWDLHQVAFIDNLHGIVVGDAGTALLTNDAGLTWRPVNLPTTADIRSVLPVDSNSFIFAGDEVTGSISAAGENAELDAIFPDERFEAIFSLHGSPTALAKTAGVENLYLAGPPGKMYSRPVTLTGIHEPSAVIPGKYSLSQNYPNPFNPGTMISYELPVNSHVTLAVYNLLGERIAVLADDEESPGRKSIEWMAGALPSGVYFYRLQAVSPGNQAESFTQVRKMMLIK
jgi:photosystem II stability/assembly factor-like uncharacterized protein